jgi:hypothetical protein
LPIPQGVVCEEGLCPSFKTYFPLPFINSQGKGDRGIGHNSKIRGDRLNKLNGRKSPILDISPPALE